MPAEPPRQMPDTFEEAAPTLAETHSPNHLPPVSRRRQSTVLLSAFLTICITIGFNQSFGVFQAAYASPNDTVLSPSESGNGAFIAFVGTLGAGLTWAGSIFVNPLMVRVPNARYITLPGVVLMSLGFGLAGQATRVSEEDGSVSAAVMCLLWGTVAHLY